MYLNNILILITRITSIPHKKLNKNITLNISKNKYDMLVGISYFGVGNIEHVYHLLVRGILFDNNK